MKKVKSNQDLVHEFATNEFNSGKVNSYGNLNYIGDKIYSYRHHCIGQKIGPRKILLVDYNYSPTTSKHNALLRSAVSHYEKILVPNPESIKISIQTLCKRNSEKIEKLKKSKIHHKYKIYLEIIWNQSKINELLTYASISIDDALSLNLSKRLLLDAYYFVQTTGDEFEQIKTQIDEYEKNRSAKKEKTKEEKEKAREKAFAKKLKEWREHKRNFFFTNSNEYQYLRVSKNGNFVETSKGVKIGISESLQFANKFLLGDKITGLQIGDYRIDRQSENFVKIGCHTISRDEIQLMVSTVKESQKVGEYIESLVP